MNKTYIRCPEHVYMIIWGWNIRKKLTKDQQKCPWGGLKPWDSKLPKAAWFILSGNQSTLRTWFMDGQNVVSNCEHNAHCTLSEFNFKNHAGEAPRCEVVSRCNFWKFKLSFSWLKGPISAGIFLIFWGLIIGGYVTF